MSYIPHNAPDSSSWSPPCAIPCSRPHVDNDGGVTGPPASRPPLPRKAQRRRKRHVPVGPAGVWFQNFQSPSDNNNHNNGRRATKTTTTHASRKNDETNNDDDDDDDDDEEEEEDQQDALQHLRRSLQRRRTTHSSSNAMSNFSSPAWIAMQCDCRWVTPSLASHLSIVERYEQLRSHVPLHFTMIPELIGISKNNHYLDCNNNHNNNDRDPWFCEHIMVLVANIHGSTTANGWTVTLTDETGATLTAWIQPDSIRRQLQRPTTTNTDCNSSSTAAKAWLRTGCVWWLQNTTLLLSPDSPEMGRLSFLLLVGESNVKQVWTPSDGEALSDERYIQWIEQRNQVGVLPNGDGHEEDILSTSTTTDSTDCHRQMRERSVPYLRDGTVRALSSQKTLNQIGTPKLHQRSSVQLSQQQSKLSETTCCDVPSFPRTIAATLTATTVASHHRTNQTLASTPPLHASAIASSRRYDHTDESQFTAHCSTFSSRNEVAPDKLSPIVPNSPTTNLSEDTVLKRRRPVEQSSVRESMSQNIEKNVQDRPKQMSQSETQITTSCHRTTHTPIREALKSNKKSASSKKRTMSSLQKRRRKAASSKLWTGAMCLEFSDDDDDDDDDDDYNQGDRETPPMQHNVSVKTGQNEKDRESPKSKRSLFRQDALHELANILSSDDETDNEVQNYFTTVS